MPAWDSPFYYRSPDDLPSVLNIPAKFRQNETPSWTDGAYLDANGNSYQSTAYTLTYVLAGPSTSPVSIVATAFGQGWSTTITPTLAARLLAGVYWWQGILTATNFRLVAGEGELAIEVDLGALTGVYDGRTTAEKALANWEACYLALAGTGTAAPAKSYKIGNREMTYQDLKEVEGAVSYWRSRVASEKDSNGGGKSRRLLARWSRQH